MDGRSTTRTSKVVPVTHTHEHRMDRMRDGRYTRAAQTSDQICYRSSRLREAERG